ncbi:testis-expressed protein 44 [Elephas maximus indicus]|uniref:testis-expressed protein 44 n=1 Tax=Elephas maximus indicus TaxID=99487 RepID=UPI0021161E97|nr:testis-expressed protein 44 [Elephas maximus indicus]
MTTKPSGEAEATNNPLHGTPEASLGTVADTQSTDSTAEGSPNQASSTSAPADQQDVSQASAQPVASEAKSKSGGVPEESKRPKEVKFLLLDQAPFALQASTSLQNTSVVKPVQEAKTSNSQLTLLQHILVKEETPQTQDVPSGKLGLTPPTPSAETQPTESPAGQPDLDTNAVSPATQPAGGAKDQPDTQAAGNTETTQEQPGDPEASSPLVDSSDEPQAQSFSLSQGCSTPASPALHPVALGRRPLDSNLYMANEENNYMRSMTSLLGGGEGSISSLADILVWSETTMGMATGFLGSGHASVTDLLQGTGPSLRSASSILDSASLAFSSGLVAGTGSALRSVIHMLETVERRTIEGIRSAVRFLTSHLTPPRAPAGPSCD